MDQISYAHSAKQSKRIKRFIAEPDSTSGLVSLPKVIEAGENITIPDGRVVVHPNLEINGTLTIENDGELFVPFGGTLVSSDLMHPVDTIDDLRNATGKYKYIYVTGYHTKDDGAFGSNMFVWDEDSTETDNGGTIIKCTTVTTGRYKLKYSGAVNVKWFGAKGDGVTDDTVSIQKAMNLLQKLEIPTGTYITTQTLTALTLNINGVSGDNSNIIIHNTDVSDDAIISITGHYNNKTYSSIEGITIKGILGSNKIGISFTNSNTEDIDAKLFNVLFHTLNTGIYCKGRGLSVDTCGFVVLNTAIQLDRNSPLIEGANPDQKLKTGQRAYKIVNNRFHGMGYGRAIFVDSANPDNQYTTGIFFDSNYIDTPIQIMVGPCRSSVFSNNIHIYTGTGMLPIFESTVAWYRVNIINNMFGNIDSPTYYFYDRIINIEADVGSLNFSGNTVWKTRNEVINVDGAFADSIISNNVLKEVCFNAETGEMSVFSFCKAPYQADNNVISGNTIRLHNEPSTNVQSNGKYLVKYLSNNVYDQIITDNIQPYFMMSSNSIVNDPGTVLKKYIKKQSSNVIRDNTAAPSQLLISQDVVKTTPTSNYLVEFTAQIANGLGSATNFIAFRLSVNGTEVTDTIYAIPTSSSLTVSGSWIVETDNVTNISLLISDGTSGSQNFTVDSKTYLKITEVQG